MNREYGINGTITPLNDVVVVIPCFNAGDRVRAVVAAVRSQVARVILVDDGSTDGGADQATDLAQVLRFERNRGKGHALIAGIEQALNMPDLRVIALMDADGQHDAGALPGLYDAFLHEQADLLVGARRFDRRQAPWASRIGNKTTAWITARMFGCDLPDTQSGFRLLSPRFARAFVNTVPGGRYETEMRMLVMAIRGDYKIASAPIATIYEAGNANSHFRKIRDSLRVYVALLQEMVRGRSC